MRLPVQIALVAGLLTASVTAALPASPLLARGMTEDRVEGLALEWFDRMRAGRIDRTQLSADYSAQLTDDAVQAMSRYLEGHDFGASPTGAGVLRTRTSGE